METSPPSLQTLQTKLDELWEHHLLLLDQYDIAQKQIQKGFSSGFFSLAQATFRSPNKIRYGRDYYDERMQALRRVDVGGVGGDGGEGLRLRVLVRGGKGMATDEKGADKGGEEEEEEEEGKEEEEKEGAKVDQLPTPPSTPSPDQAEGDSAPEPNEPETLNEEDKKNTAPDNNTKEEKPTTPEQTDEEKTKNKPRDDPVNWFGILVPAQLRQSQASFVQAVEGPIGDAVVAAWGMKRVEVEIRRVRKEIKRVEKRGLVGEEK